MLRPSVCRRPDTAGCRRGARTAGISRSLGPSSPRYALASVRTSAPSAWPASRTRSGGAQGRSMGLEETVGEGIGLGVQYQVDVALAQQADILRGARRPDEAQSLQPLAKARAERRRRRTRGTRCRRRGSPAAARNSSTATCGIWRYGARGSSPRGEQRAQAVDGVGAGRRGAEAVVEDLQRQRTAIAGRDDRREEACRSKPP